MGTLVFKDFISRRVMTIAFKLISFKLLTMLREFLRYDGLIVPWSTVKIHTIIFVSLWGASESVDLIGHTGMQAFFVNLENRKMHVF